MAGLSKQEVMLIVNQYIGTSGGYLGDFSYRTHAEFYPEYCDLDINPSDYPGTTRERFMTILESARPEIQAKIIRGVITRFPPDAENKPLSRTPELAGQLTQIVLRLRGSPSVPNPDLRLTSAAVERAIEDAQLMIDKGRPVSAVDRVHTALHGYLRAACKEEGIAYDADDGMAKLLKFLRQQHPSLRDLGPRPQNSERILQSFAQVMDALNPIRNNLSVAHPNEEFLGSDEALLVIDAARTILRYLDGKLVR